MPMDSLHPTGKRERSEEDASPDASDYKKRRAPGTSSRGVANLTPDQLAKKRANDREAQRAIRERTKNQIETLERKIRELTSQQPYQELQNVLRQKEAVEAENADIRKRLASVLSVIQPLLGQQQLACDAPYSSPMQPSPIQPYIQLRPDSSSNANVSTPRSISSPNAGSSWQYPNTMIAGDGRNITQARAFHQQRYDLAHGLTMGPERLGLDFLLDGSQQVTKMSNGMNDISHSPGYFHPQMRHDKGGSMHQKVGSRGSSTPQLEYSMSNTHAELTAHTAPIKNSAPTCPLDSILLDFLHERQKQAAEGVATPKLVGPAYPSVSSLLNPDVDSHPLSKVFTDILGTFPDLSTLPEKVAVLYIMFLIMRWQISPTQENYDRLPDWVTPRPSQLFTPHPAWIDHLPWPRMRDKLVRDYVLPEYLFDNFFIPFTTTLSLNWPYEPTDALLASMDSDELMINPVFERHLRQLENWSLGPAFANAFPGLAETYRLKTEGDRRL